jgi:hypothetical protein
MGFRRWSTSTSASVQVAGGPDHRYDLFDFIFGGFGMAALLFCKTVVMAVLF